MGIVTSRGAEFEEGVDYNAMNSMVGMAAIGFKVADYSLQPPQAIAILAAGDQVDDVFGKGNDKFEKISGIDRVNYKGADKQLHININGKAYDLENNKLYNKDTEEFDIDANILMYKKSDTEYILEVDGKLIHIEKAHEYTSTSGDHPTLYIKPASFTVYDSQTEMDRFTDFALSKGINEHTVLGAKIVLKTLMRNMGYPIDKLDEAFMNPQNDYLAFVNQTLSPVIEAGLTATMSGLKSAVDFLKKIVQKASS
jgi:hypothetical protein